MSTFGDLIKNIPEVPEDQDKGGGGGGVAFSHCTIEVGWTVGGGREGDDNFQSYNMADPQAQAPALEAARRIGRPSRAIRMTFPAGQTWKADGTPYNMTDDFAEIHVDWVDKESGKDMYSFAIEQLAGLEIPHTPYTTFAKLAYVDDPRENNFAYRTRDKFVNGQPVIGDDGQVVQERVKRQWRFPVKLYPNEVLMRSDFRVGSENGTSPTDLASGLSVPELFSKVPGEWVKYAPEILEKLQALAKDLEVDIDDLRPGDMKRVVRQGRYYDVDNDPVGVQPILDLITHRERFGKNEIPF